VEEEAADDANAGGEDYAGDGGEEALLPGGGGDEEGGVHEVAEGEDAEEEGERSAEIEKHGVASGRGEAPEEISIARCVARGSYKAKGAAPAFFLCRRQEAVIEEGFLTSRTSFGTTFFG
jgi:hypothetical protein